MVGWVCEWSDGEEGGKLGWIARGWLVMAHMLVGALGGLRCLRVAGEAAVCGRRDVTGAEK